MSPPDQVAKKQRPLAAIFGCAGLELGADEAAFFKEVNPLGFILFARNIDTPEQVKALVASLRASVDRAEAPVLIDQEGGRVQRLGPPHWPTYPAAARYGTLYEKDPERGKEAARLGGRLVGADLAQLGISVDCAPVLDVPQPGSDPIIGDRAFAQTAPAISELALAFAQGLMDEGVAPVIKHIPGHGRASVDSHKELPRLETSHDELAAVDFTTFKALNYMPWAMTAHVVYADLDPDHPATLSPKVIKEWVRREIGFRGFLVSDDLSMDALSGAMKDRATAALDAGCDAVLHCNGNMEEMVEVAAGAKVMSGPVWARFALGNLQRHLADEEETFDPTQVRARFDELMSE